MSKVLAPILFFIVAVGLFFSYLKPAYSELQASKERLENIDLAIQESDMLLKNYADLRDKNSAISVQDKKNILKILPDAVDAVRLILDIDALATKHSVTVSSFVVPQIESDFPAKNSTSRNSNVPVEDEEPLGKAILTIECTGEYEDFKPFLLDIERSMSLMDVVELEVSVAEVTEKNKGQEEETTYKLGLQTYWLKEIK